MAIDVLLVIAATVFATAGFVVVDVDDQVFPPLTSAERVAGLVQAGAAFVAGATSLAIAVLRSRRDGCKTVVLRRVPGMVLVVLACGALAAGLGASYAGGAVALLAATALAATLLVAGARLLRVR